jgi:3-oxosteroid 1-dehydrogenase
MTVSSKATPTGSAGVTATRTADVIVVGSGPAGLSAALFAHRLGQQVLILEKGATHGGTALKAVACFWVPNNDLMRARGYHDTKESTLRFIARSARPLGYDPADPHLGLADWQYRQLEAFYDNAWTAVQTLQEMDALHTTIDSPLGVLLPDYLVLPEDETPVGRALFPMRADGTVGDGIDMINQLKAGVDRRGIPLLLHHQVTDVVLDDAGAVVGVTAATPQDPAATFSAGKAVIFASGGFTHNDEMRRNFLSGPTFGGCAVTTNTGDFIDIAGRLGAQLRNMNYAWMAPLLVEKAVAQDPGLYGICLCGGDAMLWVNKYGRRITNEKAPYNEVTQSFFHWDPHRAEYPNVVQFMIWDQRVADRYGLDGYGNPVPPDPDQAPHVLRADTLGELADRIDRRLASLAPHTGGVRLEPGFTDTLRNTVATFNAYARAGKDPEFHRGETPIEPLYSGPAQEDNPANPTMYPLADTGPYYAVIIGAGTLDTKGGPLTSPNGQVLGRSGAPIPGLYGVGNCVASPSGQAFHAGGATIGPIFATAYLTAEAASREPVRQPATR